MLVQQLLLETLEDLTDDNFETLKWYLSMKILEGCNPIRKAHLQNATRVQTVGKIVESYGENLAVQVTLEVLRKMNLNGPAEDLESRHAAATPSSSSSSDSSAVAPLAAPASMMAQQGGVIIAPQVAGTNSGQWNITINK